MSLTAACHPGWERKVKITRYAEAFIGGGAVFFYLSQKFSFFDDLYAGYTIVRVPARRMINCNGSPRGNIDELIITNYDPGTR